MLEPFPSTSQELPQAPRLAGSRTHFRRQNPGCAACHMLAETCFPNLMQACWVLFLEPILSSSQELQQGQRLCDSIVSLHVLAWPQTSSILVLEPTVDAVRVQSVGKRGTTDQILLMKLCISKSLQAYCRHQHSVKTLSWSQSLDVSKNF